MDAMYAWLFLILGVLLLHYLLLLAIVWQLHEMSRQLSELLQVILCCIKSGEE